MDDPAGTHEKNRNTGKRHEHIVPLAKHTPDVLRKLHKFTGGEGYMFPQFLGLWSQLHGV